MVVIVNFEVGEIIVVYVDKCLKEGSFWNNVGFLKISFNELFFVGIGKV